MLHQSGAAQTMVEAVLPLATLLPPRWAHEQILGRHVHAHTHAMQGVSNYNVLQLTLTNFQSGAHPKL